MSILRHESVECLPIIHGRLAFALEVRRRMLEKRYAAVAVELPPTLFDAVHEAVENLPTVSVVTYTDRPRFLDPDGWVYYVPIQPADAVVEALRIAAGERLPRYFVDAEVDDFSADPVTLPDPHALHTLGLERYFEECLPVLARHPRSPLDELREAHMAARLGELQATHDGEILFICGMAHWLGVKRHLQRGSGRLHAGAGVAEELTTYVAEGRSLPHLLGEMPAMAAAYERHRSGFELDDFDPIEALKHLFLTARDAHADGFPGSLERPRLNAMRIALDFARRMTVRQGFLIPSLYTLTVAANGVVGNDYALVLLETAHDYPWNPFLEEADSDELGRGERERSDQPAEGAGQDRARDGEAESYEAEGIEASFGEGNALPLGSFAMESAQLDGAPARTRRRTPGTAFSYGRLRLERRPDSRRRTEYEKNWNPYRQCSWPPEDLVIENFRDYVGKRALSLAKVATQRSEPFTTSFLDGLDIRATVRDVIDRRIFVKEEPRIPGGVGALVVIFEEDDFGERYPWRSTWMAEHRNESTLAFYATNFMEDIIGPGVGRSHYGGCMLIFPPIGIPDIWEDMKFERARTPSERLLLAAIYWSQDYFVVHVGGRPPSEDVKAEARRRQKHVLHLPLSTFSTRTLERLRRVHVLNGQEVRSWAQWFIR